MVLDLLDPQTLGRLVLIIILMVISAAAGYAKGFKEGKREGIARRKSPEEIHAQLILIIGSTLAAVFLIVTVGITYALIFVTQPVSAQAPNDAAFIDLLKTLAIFLTGSLGGVLAGNGLKSKPKPQDTPTNTQGS